MKQGLQTGYCSFLVLAHSNSKMGCCCSRSEYKAKETLYPDLDIFADCPQEDTPNGGEKKESKEERLKKEIALQIDIEGKLKMLKEDTGLVGHGGVKLFKMRNLASKKEGLVQADSVAKIGTVECEE